MANNTKIRRYYPRDRLAQLVVGIVFILNVTCAMAFICQPQKYMGGFEIDGVQGRVMVQAIGILFLMWNATYPLVIDNPSRHKALFGVILAQQAIGVFGESWLMISLPAGHAALQATGLRFIYFDSAGLIFMGLAFYFLMKK
ncbi:MAG: hypothetical protein JW908_09525 [Anaerolineales bacterium]|nr:hypothetical protein [Anaerolineales bacterium]